MTNNNTPNPSSDLHSRFSNLHVDERFTNTSAPPSAHSSAPPQPALSAFNTNPSQRLTGYPDPMDAYSFYGTPLIPQLDQPPFSPVNAGFGFAHPGTMADALQNQFEYGQADPYASAGTLGLGLGMTVGLDGMPITLRGQGGQPLQHQRQGQGVAGYRGTGDRQGRIGEPRSPVGRGFNKQPVMREGQGRKAEQGQGYGFGGGGAYWQTPTGVFMERGKKGQTDYDRISARSLQHRQNNGFSPFTPQAPNPAFPKYNPGQRNTFIPYGSGPQSYPQVPYIQGPAPGFPLRQAHFGGQGSNVQNHYRLHGNCSGKPRKFADQPKSALLEDFRLAKSDRHWDLSEIFGHIIEFSGDQYGSRLIQTKLELASPQDRQAIYNEIYPNALTLMTDVFGNYVIQKMFDSGTEEQIRGLCKKMEGQVYELSMQMYGCRVVQKALDRVNEPQKLAIIKEFDGKLVDCIKSANANHVIQRLIQCDPPKSVPDAFLGHVMELALHSYGCRVLQKAVEYLPLEKKKDLLEELHDCSRTLIEDNFGNYVVQSMITAAGPEHRARVVQVLKNQVWALSRQKFASNVVEKAILHSEPNDRRELVYELVNIREDGSSRVLQLIRDEYANFVFQTCLKHAERSQRQQLLDAVVPILNSIRHTPPGRRLEAILIEMQQDGFTLAPASPSHTLPAKPPITNATPTAAHLLPLHPLAKSTSNTLSETNSTVTAGSSDMSRSGSSSTRITSPDTSGRGLRPTASAPPRSDQASMSKGAAGKVKVEKGKAKAKEDADAQVPADENGVKQENLLDLLA